MNIGKHEKKCLEKYLDTNDEVVFKNHIIEYDGYDNYGPKGVLHDFTIVIKKNNKLFKEIFYREKWFYSEDNDEYTPLNISLHL